MPLDVEAILAECVGMEPNVLRGHAVYLRARMPEVPLQADHARIMAEDILLSAKSLEDARANLRAVCADLTAAHARMAELEAEAGRLRAEGESLANGYRLADLMQDEELQRLCGVFGVTVETRMGAALEGRP